MTLTDTTSGSLELAQAEVASVLNDDALLALAGIRGKSKLSADALVLAHGELTEEHEAAAVAHISSGATLGSQAPTLKAIRHTHHRLAQLLAIGVDETKAAMLCNYSVSRVSILKSDPAFQELLAYYSKTVETQWADFVSTANGLSMDMLQELQSRLDTSPEQFTVGQLTETLKVLADRSGHAPVTKSVQVNVNADVGDRIEAARRRLQQLGTEAVNAVG